MAEMKPLSRPCPICGASRAERLHTQRFTLPEGLALPATYDVVACSGCGFAFADTPASQADYDAYYRALSRYEDASVASGTGDAPWERARFERLAELIAGHVPPEARLLDVGCANGGLLKTLRRRGFSRLAGLDPAPGCVRHLASEGFHAAEGSLLAPPEGLGGFDMVVLSHVLEHVRDLAGAVAAARRLLAPGGRLYVEVPDAARYPAFYVVPYYYFDCEHINHFDRASLDNAFVPQGFRREAEGTRDLPASATGLYPARYAVYRRDAEAAGAITPGREAAVGIEGYLRLSAERSGLPAIAALAASGEPVVVWGAGSYALRLLAEGPLAQCHLVAFLDRDAKKQGTRLGDVPVLAPEALAGLEHRGPVLVASALHAQAIVEELRGQGLDNPVLVLS